MQCMNRENVLNLRSFWQIQIVGWCCFYLFNLLESIHNFLTQRVSIKEQTVPIFFMFLGSCALRPFCRQLLRQSQSWIAFELKAAAAAMVTSIPVAGAACLILGNPSSTYPGTLWLQLRCGPVSFSLSGAVCISALSNGSNPAKRGSGCFAPSPRSERRACLHFAIS